MANQYVFISDGVTSKVMTILELIPETDWTAEDIEAIAKLEAPESYKGNWLEDFIVQRVG